MTVIEASRNLFDFFKDNDVFSLDKDFNKVVLITLEDKVDRAIVRKALKSFEDQGLVVALDSIKNEEEPGQSSFWALNKPLVEYSQTLELSFPTIYAITSTINTICDDLEVEQGKVDPMQLTEKDIQNLVLIIGKMKEESALND